ncbi:MAG TPA: OmpH family outer membrane protein [Terracidiphilus sp.]|nr:OmpH family outer membrane protein [Terracidiphilus sp.]
MKQPVAYIAALFCSFAIGAAAQGDTSSAPATAPAGPSKIAVIEFQSAVTATNEFQRDFADLQKKYDPKRQQLKTLNDQVESLKKQLQDQSSTLSEADRQSRARVIDEKTKELQRDAEDDQNDFNQDMRDTFNKVAQKVGQVLISYSKEHGYTVVLDATQAQDQSPMVLYATDATNISKAIVDAYNVKSGVPAPAPGSPRPTVPAAKPGATAPRTAPAAPAPH